MKSSALKKKRTPHLQAIEAQAQLIQTEKLASLGTMAAGVAHEINNPLSFMLGNMETLAEYSESLSKILEAYQDLETAVEKEKSPAIHLNIKKVRETKSREDYSSISSDYESLIRESIEGILRIKEIVKGLSTFSRVDGDESQLANLNEVLDASLRVVWNELKHKVSLTKDYGLLTQTLCHPGQLMQVFSNLLINAGQAIEDKGEITIRSRKIKNKIHLTFQDTGKGISPENMKQLFTPFFTTKPAGTGTGLGLSVSYGIVKSHKGTISVTSKVGVGTTFEISIPIQGESK